MTFDEIAVPGGGTTTGGVAPGNVGLVVRVPHAAT